jgi:hypothetical protein
VAGGGLIMIGHSSVLFRKVDFIASGGYVEDSIAAEDVDFFERIATATDGVVVNVAEPLFYYRKKRGGVSQEGFWQQQVRFDYIVEARHRRQCGLPELSAEEYQAQLHAQRWTSRARRQWYWTGAFFYRRGSVNVVNRHRLVGGWQLAAAAVLRPGLVWDGLRRYRIKPTIPA